MSPTTVKALDHKAQIVPVELNGHEVCCVHDRTWFVHAGQMKEALGYEPTTNAGVITRHAKKSQLRTREFARHSSHMWVSIAVLQGRARSKRFSRHRTALIDILVDRLLFDAAPMASGTTIAEAEVTPNEEPTPSITLGSMEANGSEVMQAVSFGDKPVRVFIDEDNDIMVIAKDVCDAIGLTNVSQAVDPIPIRKKVLRLVYTPGGPQETWAISEGAMYTLVARSRRPEAEKFVDWIETVLVSIRKKGFYAVPNARVQELVAESMHGELLARAVDTMAVITNRLGMTEARMTQMEQRPQPQPVSAGPQMSEEQARRLVQEQMDIKTKTRDHSTGPYYGAPFPLEYRGWFLPTGIAKNVETPEELRNFLPVGEKYKTLGATDVLRLLAFYDVLEYQQLTPEGCLKWVPKGRLAEKKGTSWVIINQCVGHHSTGRPVYKELILFKPEYAQKIIKFWTENVKPRELIRRMICSWPSKYRKKDMDEFLSKEEAKKYWTMKQSGIDPITGTPPAADEDDGDGA